MKPFYIFILFFCYTLSSVAQTDAISYQAVILDPNAHELPGQDATGTILANTPVTLRFTILNEVGGIDYQETQQTSTDAYGLVNVFIGEGTPTLGLFSEIDWDGSPKDLQVEIDLKQGNSYEALSLQKLTFVPFAYHRNISANGNLTVEGFSQFNNNVTIEGPTVVNNTLNVEAETNLNDNLSVGKNTNIEEGLTVNGNTNLNSSLNVNNDAQSQLSGTLLVNGNTTLEADLTVSGSTTLNNTLKVDQASATQLTGSLTVEGITTLNNDFIINGETIMNNGLSVNGPTQLNGTLNVVSEANFQDALNAEGVTTLQNSLTVENESPTLLSGTLTVNGESVVNNTLEVQGETKIHDNLLVDNKAQIGSDLGVSGTTTLFDTLTVQNQASSNLTGALNVDGITNLENEFNVNNTSTSNLSGMLNVEGTSNLNSDLNVQGVSNLESELNVNNASVTNLSGMLNVTGVSNLNNALNVSGVANLESEFNVNNASVSNLSGILNVTGITNLNNELHVAGTSIFNDDVTINGELNINDKIEAAGLYVSSDTGVEGNYVAVFENTSGTKDADGIAIKLETETLSMNNHFVSFYGDNDYLAGRIESYDFYGLELLESFPEPDFSTLIDVFDFSQVLEWTPPSLDFDTGSLPTAEWNPGTRPYLVYGNPSQCEGSNSTELEFCIQDLFEINFKFGELPSLDFTGGSLPTADFDIGTLDLNFDNFFNPTAGANAASQIGAMAGWGYRNGNPGFLPTTPWKIALTPVILTAQQLARDQGVVYGSKGADYAEWLEKENPEEEYMFGEVVGVKGGKISRNTEDADQVMTISFNPIVLGNMPEAGKEENYEKVGFMGQVPALVAGKVAIGDFIVASGNNDGYAIAIAPEDIALQDLKNIIGRAWSESNPSNLSMINVSVGLKTNEWIIIFEKQKEKMEAMQKQLDQLQQLNEKVEAIQSKIKQLELN